MTTQKSYDNVSTKVSNLNYTLQPVYTIPMDQVTAYWQDVMDAGLLKYRLPEILNPDLSHVYDMLQRMVGTSFLVLDKSKRVCAEFMLDNFQGLCAMSHFSIHPSKRGPEAVALGKAAISSIRTLTRTTPAETPYVDTLLGLTPKSNKLAIRYAENIGYKMRFELPNSFWIARKNQYETGILSTLSLRDS